jgi:NAD(P)-dependent dehydrogenase (short-subunit alcohol dehydrogenase family)
MECAPWLRINSICPGYVLTPMQKAEYTAEMMDAVNARIPMGRHADPEEIPWGVMRTPKKLPLCLHF